MKNVIIALLISTLVSVTAFADGFRCESLDLTVTAYNQVQPELGTRNAAVMVVSDPNVQSDRKTIAVFKRSNSTLKNSSASYTGKVDHRYTGLSRRGESILSTKLGQLAYIQLFVDFKYGENLLNGEEARGVLSLIKRDNSRIYHEMVCKRYLKN